MAHKCCPGLTPDLCSEVNLTQTSCEANAKLFSGVVTSCYSGLPWPRSILVAESLIESQGESLHQPLQGEGQSVGVSTDSYSFRLVSDLVPQPKAEI